MRARTQAISGLAGATMFSQRWRPLSKSRLSSWKVLWTEIHSDSMAPDEENNAAESAGRQKIPWPGIIAGLVIIVLALIGYLSFRGTKETVDKSVGIVDRGLALAEKALEQGPAIAEGFRHGRITQTFRSSLPAIQSTGGDVLELATSESEEIITREEERRIGWERIYLGKTVAEIRARVTFRYHIRLSDSWELTVRSNICIVRAPQIRPSLPPAIHSDTMEKRAESGWARFDKNEKLAELEKSMTGIFSERAKDPLHLESVREASRRSVAEFVKRWLLKEDHWRTDRFTSIIVIFPDEIEPAAKLEAADQPPVIRFEN